MTTDQAQAMAQIFLKELEEEYQTTRKVLAAVPEDRLEFKLGEKGRTARELAWHLAGADLYFGEGIASGTFAAEEEPPAPATIAEMLAIYEKTPAILERIKALTGEQLVAPQQFFTFNFPRVMYLSFWIRHTVHHRGQLSTYLRAMNARVPSIYGGSADEPFQAEAAV